MSPVQAPETTGSRGTPAPSVLLKKSAIQEQVPLNGSPALYTNGAETHRNGHAKPAPSDGNTLPSNYQATTNLITGRKQCPFALPTTFPTGCEGEICHGSLMDKYGSPQGGIDRPLHEITQEAVEYITEFYKENKLPTDQRDARIAEVRQSLNETGYYIHTYDELSFGVKTAWRNARRCIMRSQWATIQTIDRRNITTAEEMLDACFWHLKEATNDGKIRPTISVFPQKLPGREGPRIWNPQLVRYAGYVLKNGTIIGDPANVEITKRAIELGWKPRFGRFDALPLIAMADGGEPVWRDLPEESLLEVPITHPTLPWFNELDLKWNAHPALSSLCITIGGIDYTAAPFSGWFLSTEIASRNFSDEQRYNMLPEIGRRLGMPMNNRSLWKDRAMIELNVAILHSFEQANVTLVDHHSASDSFVAWYDKEIKTRGHCPADWVWIVPPISSGATSVFHQEMYNYMIKPAIIPPIEPAWEIYWRRAGRPAIDEAPAVAQTVSSSDANAIKIGYATETGTAQRYAQKLKTFLKGRELEVVDELVELDELNLDQLTGTLLVVTSTFGEGDPPSGAIEFAERLAGAAAKVQPDSQISGSLALRYAVFGLGNSRYTKTYQQFPRTVDASLENIGARRIIPFGQGDDDIGNVDEVFEQWAATLAIAIEVGTETKGVTNEQSAVSSLAAFRSGLEQLASFVEYQVATQTTLYNDGAPGEGQRAFYHLELKRSDGKPIDYEEGDLISLLPVTDVDTIGMVKDLLAAKGAEPLNGIPISEICGNYLDLLQPLTPELQAIAGEAIDGSTLEALKQLTSSSEALSSAVHLLPLKVPRYFSIASSPSRGIDTIHLTVAHLFQGRVSTALVEPDLKSASAFKIRGKLHKSKGFHLPANSSVPLILVAAGTGIAPIRGFLQSRAALHAANQGGRVLCLLGFRSPEEHLYRDESSLFSSDGATTYVAYSRITPRRRVGDLIMSHSDTVTNMLDEGAYVLICGSHAMGKAVEDALIEALRCSKGFDWEESKAHLIKLKREGRIMSDTYSHGSV